MDENARLEFDRQQEADRRNREQYCGNCGTLAPGGGYCASCRVMLSATENSGGSASPVMELTINDVIADAFRTERQIDDAHERRADDWFERTRRYCPNCSGESPSGGFCSGCMFLLQLETGQGRVEPGDWSDSPPALLGEALSPPEDSHDPEMGFANPQCGVDMDTTTAGSDTSEYDNLSPAEYRLEDHHILPQVFRERFEAIDGVNVDDVTATMYAFQHHAVHSDGFNADWDMFFQTADISGVEPTKDDVMEYARYLMEKYGFSDAPIHEFRDKSGDLGPYI